MSSTTPDDTISMSRPSGTDLILDAPQLQSDDFEGCGMTLNENDIQMINEFEALWKDYLQANPNILHAGKKGMRIETLENRVIAMQTAKRNVHAELQRQLDFFDHSKEQLETNFLQEKERSEKQLEKMLAEMEPKLDAIGTSMRHLEANGEWELFMQVLNEAVEQSEVQPLPGDGLSTVFGIPSHVSSRAKSNVMKPSAKAMFLNNVTGSDVHMHSRDFLLRAYRIDHELLQAQVRVLQRDVERMERNAETMELVGNFLTEHNIWGLLATNSNSSSNTVVKHNGAGTITLR